MNIVEKCFSEVVKGNRYDLEAASKHNWQLIEDKVKAKDMPKIESEFVSENHVGCCLHYGMTLFKLLRENGIRCYIAITMEENPNTHKKTDNHVSVCYIRYGKRFIADPVEKLKGCKGDFSHIPFEEYVLQQGMLKLYDPYGEYGEELFFKDFLSHPIEIIE